MKEKIQNRIKIVLLLLFIFICENNYFLANNITPLEKISSISKETIHEELINQPPIVSQSLAWVLIPQTNTKYFSPDSSPGIGDSVVYSFAVNEAQNYTLNISAYYDPIDNFAGSIGVGEGIETCAYLMPNGTWLVVGLEIRLDQVGSTIHLGIGTNASNLVWHTVGKYNYTDSIAVVGDESGKIRIIFFEMLGLYKPFTGINCFLSDDWGQSWTNRTLMNYTDYSPVAIYGISAAAYKGNFTYAWGGASYTNKNAKGGQYPLENSTIVAVEETTTEGWKLPGNITALGGPLNPRRGCRCPQLFYNRTNDNGTLMMAYDYHQQPGIDHDTQRCALVQFEDGINSSVIQNWSISFRQNYLRDFPMVHCIKDYSSEVFYFVDNTNMVNYHEEGVRNATWGQDVISQPLDRFQTESARAFNIYAINGPKCFAGWVLNEEGKRVPGILDCKTTFNVRKIEDVVEAYSTKSHTFNGKDQYGNSREARAYSFNIHVSNTLVGYNDLIIFVDETPITMTCIPSNNYISPFSSPNTNDKFTLDVYANKPGTATLTISKDQPEFGQTIIDKDLTYITYSVLCGDGINYYLFFTNAQDEIARLMYVKSIDGGLSWSDPILIDSTLSQSQQYVSKCAIFTGTELYIWTIDVSQYLYYSSDFGTTWIKQRLNRAIYSVTSDLICWNYAYTSTQMIINKSLDFGYTWENFCIIDNVNASTFNLQDAVYDPISGNYSFLFSRDSKRETYFVTAIHNGTVVSFSDNIFTFYQPVLNDYTDAARLDLRWIDENSTELIITTAAKNTISLTDYTSDLAYCVSNGSLTFSEWQDFKDINGMNIPTYAIPYGKCYDIVFPKYGTPCHATGNVVNGMSAEKWKITTASTLIYSISEELDNNYEAELNFYGVTGNGDPLWDTQNLTWTCEVLDQAGFKDSLPGILFIDNFDPSWNPFSLNLNPSNPYPINNVNISVLITEENPSSIQVRYRYRNPNSGWNYRSMFWTPTNNPSEWNCTVIIPGQDVEYVEWSILAEDYCANKLEILDGEQYFRYAKPFYEYIKESGVIAPTLYDDWTWSYVITSGNDHVADVFVRMEFDNNLTQVDYSIVPAGEFNNRYSIPINHTLLHSNAIYKLMYRTDLNQLTTIETISLETPDIRIEEQEEPPETIDLNEIDSLTVSFIVPEFIEYIDYVYIEYEYDDGEGTHKEKLDATGSLYEYKFEDIPEDCTILTYKVFAVDIYGNEIDLGKDRSVNILPKLPSLEMDSGQQVFIMFIALFVGIACGLLYIAVMSSKGSERTLYEDVFRKSKVDSLKEITTNQVKEKPTEGKALDVGKVKKLTSIGLTGFGFIACAGFAIFYILILRSPEISMLFFTGAFVLAITLWVLLSAHTADKILRSTEDLSMHRAKLLLFIVSILIYVILLAIFFVGNTITWWRVRVNQQSYSIAGMTIPKALTSVTTAFFSSILLLTMSTFKQISNRREELAQALVNNDNPLAVIERRENAVSTVVNNVGKKGIIFTAIIGVVIIFASDLNLYANQAISLVIPFVIGAIGTLILITYFKKQKEMPTEALLLDHIINCPECKSQTALGSNYCENCGKEILHGQRFSKGIMCSNCKKANTQGMKHCRYCGASLESNESFMTSGEFKNNN